MDNTYPGSSFPVFITSKPSFSPSLHCLPSSVLETQSRGLQDGFGDAVSLKGCDDAKGGRSWMEVMVNTNNRAAGWFHWQGLGSCYKPNEKGAQAIDGKKIGATHGAYGYI